MNNLPKLEITEIPPYNEPVPDWLLEKIGHSGCFLLNDSDYDAKWVNDALEICRDFHELSPQIKETLSKKISGTSRGYFSKNDAEGTSYVSEGQRQIRRYSTLDLGPEVEGDPTTLEGVLRCKNMLPPDSELRKKIERLWIELSTLSSLLGQKLCAALGIHQDFLLDHSRASCSQLRLMHYLKREEQPSNSISYEAHTDSECFMLILQEQPGLQVCTRSGEWIDLHTTADAPIVVLIGDMLEIITNGALKSCFHRVKPATSERHSIVYFQGLDFNTVVQPITPFDSSSPQYQSVKFGEYLGARTLEKNKHLQDLVKSGKLKTTITYGGGNPFEDLRNRELEKIRTESIVNS